MDKLFERLNLYDILAMIFPGGLLLLAILSAGDMWEVVKEIPWIHHIMTQTILSKALCFGFLGLIFSYLLGIANHTIVTIWRAINEKWIFVWKWVMRLAYRYEINVKKDSNKEIFKQLSKESLSEIDVKELQNAYFEAHSYARTTKGTVMLTIEQQVAMLRNTIIPCVWLMVIALCKMDFSFCAIFWIVLGYWFVCGIIIWAREYKLFAIVLSTYNLKYN